MTRNSIGLIAGLGLAALILFSGPAAAQSYLGGNLRPFAVLGATTVTCTGASTITGDLGLSPGTSVTGFPAPCTNVGTIHAADATAAAAQADLTTAFNTLASQTCTLDLTGTDLGGLTLTPGTYCFSSSAALTGTLTLNAQGNPNAVWVFKTGSTLTTAGNVVFINGTTANSCGVQWQIGSSATLGSGSLIAGNILAQTSITLNTGAGLTGRALARTGAVTLDTNQVSFAACGVNAGPTGAPPPFGGPVPPPVTAAAPTPTLSEWAMIALAVLLALAGFAALRRRGA